MKKYFSSDKYGSIAYEENVWTGKKKIYVGGQVLNKETNKIYSASIKGQSIIANLNGNIFKGITLNVGNETFTISEKNTWYEIVLAFIPLLLVLIWGNSVALCNIIPIVGGVIGGVVGAMFSLLSITYMNKAKKPLYKVLIGLGAIILTFVVCFLLALLFLSIVQR